MTFPFLPTRTLALFATVFLLSVWTHFFATLTTTITLQPPPSQQQQQQQQQQLSTFVPLHTEQPFINTNREALITSCVMLCNPVPYHAEVEIAFHSYLLASGFPVCVQDENDWNFGYRAMFRPTNSTSVLLSASEFWDLVGKRNESHGLPKPMVITTLAEIVDPEFDANTQGAIAVVHTPLWTHRTNVKAVKQNWTLLFLSEQGENVWKNSSIAHAAFPEAANIPSMQMIAVWKASTSLFHNPIINIALKYTEMPFYLNWTIISDVISMNLTRSEWVKFLPNITQMKKPRLHPFDIQTWKYIVVQGKIENARRDYTTLFEWLVKSRIALDPQFKIVLVGSLLSHPLEVSLDLVLKHGLHEKVIIVPNCNYASCARVIERARLLFPCHKRNDLTYTNVRSSSSIPTAISYGVPIVGDFRVHMGYGDALAGALVEFENENILELGELGGETNGVRAGASLRKRPLKSFRTFEQAVSWAISLDMGEFKNIRIKVHQLRDEIFSNNTKQLADAIHKSQVIQQNI